MQGLRSGFCFEKGLRDLGFRPWVLLGFRALGMSRLRNLGPFRGRSCFRIVESRVAPGLQGLGFRV